MGLLGFLGGGSPAERAQKLKPKVTQKYGDPTSRQKAIAQLGSMSDPAAVSVLMARFTVSVEPQTTDAEEKEHVFELVCGFKDAAVAPVKEFLRRSDLATSWGLRILDKVLPAEDVIGACTELLQQLGTEHTRDPAKKVVLLHSLEGKSDARVAPSVVPFLDDMSDDVKIAALRTLGPLSYEPGREAILNLLTAEDTGRRVKTAAIAALHESNFGVQGYREKVEALLQEPYFLDKAGMVKRRG